MHPLYNISCIDSTYFSEINMSLYPERFVIVGFIAADGCISVNKNCKQLIFNLCNKDREILDRINLLICQNKRKISYLSGTNSNMLSITSRQICNDLERYYIVPRKTNFLKLPDLNLKFMSYYLRGYFYGDGCYHKGKQEVFHFVGNKIIMFEIHKFLTKNNIVKHAVLSNVKSSSNSLQLVLQGDNAKLFAKYIYQDDKIILLDRKHNCGL